jgi:hypothetical protein
MNRYRSAALGLVTCAAGLSLAACSAGITTTTPASSPKSSTPAASPAATHTARASSTVNIGGSIGRFPIPSGGKVVENFALDKQIEVVIGSVSPQKASSFYTSALPKAGYTITLNTLGTDSKHGTTLAIQFSGHGYKGTISAGSNIPGVSLGNSKDFLAILLSK